MEILEGFGFRYARCSALEHLMTIDCCVGDLRWALAALALRGFMAMWARGQRGFTRLVANAARHAGGKAGSAAGIAAADTMVAAGGG
jgi:hypothetical protein